MENTQANEKYYRQNGEVVQGADIPSIRRQQLKDAIRNNRLGTYNAHGRYTLSPRITKELLSITKYIYKQHYDEVMKESKDVLEFKSTASIPVFGQMEFRIVFKEKFAKLYLIENVYREFNGYQEIYGEQITEINCEDDRDSVVDYVLSLLNVKILDETDDGKIPDEDPEKVKAIIFDKLYLSIVAKNYLKESADEERETFEDIIRQLKEGGEYGKRVLKNFIDRIEKRPDIMQLKDEDGYNEALNDALIGALEVATTEEDLKDPHNKKIYDDIYKRRYKKTEEDLTKAQEDVTEKDFKKVADGVLGRDISDKLFGDQQEVASLMGEKREETRQDPQDNSLLDELLRNPIIKNVVENVAGHTVGRQGREETQDEAQDTAADQDAARRREEEAAIGRTGQTQGGEEPVQEDGKKPRAKTDEAFKAAMRRQRSQNPDDMYAEYRDKVSAAIRSGSRPITNPTLKNPIKNQNRTPYRPATTVAPENKLGDRDFNKESNNNPQVHPALSRIKGAQERAVDAASQNTVVVEGLAGQNVVASQLDQIIGDKTLNSNPIAETIVDQRQDIKERVTVPIVEDLSIDEELDDEVQATVDEQNGNLFTEREMRQINPEASGLDPLQPEEAATKEKSKTKSSPEPEEDLGMTLS